MTPEVRGPLSERVQAAVSDQPGTAGWPSLAELKSAEEEARYHHYGALSPQPEGGNGTTFHPAVHSDERGRPLVCSGCTTNIAPGDPMGIIVPNGPWRACAEREVYCEQCVEHLRRLPNRPSGLDAAPHDDQEPRKRSWAWKR